MSVKDSVANTVSLAGAGVVIVDIQNYLTIALLATGIILNVMRIRSKKQD